MWISFLWASKIVIDGKLVTTIGFVATPSHPRFEKFFFFSLRISKEVNLIGNNVPCGQFLHLKVEV